MHAAVPMIAKTVVTRFSDRDVESRPSGSSAL